MCHSSHWTNREFLPVCSRPTFSAFSLLEERLMQRYSACTVLFYAFVFAALILNTILPAKPLFFWNRQLRRMLPVLYIMASGTVIPFGLCFMGIEHLRSTRASTVVTLKSTSAGVFSVIISEEVLAGWQIFRRISAHYIDSYYPVRKGG